MSKTIFSLYESLEFNCIKIIENYVKRYKKTIYLRINCLKGRMLF